LDSSENGTENAEEILNEIFEGTGSKEREKNEQCYEQENASSYNQHTLITSFHFE
jgi:hypothetical protein